MTKLITDLTCESIEKIEEAIQAPDSEKSTIKSYLKDALDGLPLSNTKAINAVWESFSTGEPLTDEHRQALELLVADEAVVEKTRKTFARLIPIMEHNYYKKIANLDPTQEEGQKAIEGLKKSHKDALDFYKSFFQRDAEKQTVSLDNLIALIRGEEVDMNTENQESYNEEIFNARKARKHRYLTDEMMEGLKPLSAVYSKNGDLHTLGSVKNFAIPSYDEIGLAYKDMLKDGVVLLANTVENNDKMRSFVEKNNLDLDLNKSVETVCALGQQIADAWDLGVTFDLAYIKDEANDGITKKILAGLRTIIGYNIVTPYAIDVKSVSSLGVSSDDAGVFRDLRYDSYGLVPVLSQ